METIRHSHSPQSRYYFYFFCLKNVVIFFCFAVQLLSFSIRQQAYLLKWLLLFYLYINTFSNATWPFCWYRVLQYCIHIVCTSTQSLRKSDTDYVVLFVHKMHKYHIVIPFNVQYPQSYKCVSVCACVYEQRNNRLVYSERTTLAHSNLTSTHPIRCTHSFIHNYLDIPKQPFAVHTSVFNITEIIAILYSRYDVQRYLS